MVLDAVTALVLAVDAAVVVAVLDEVPEVVVEEEVADVDPVEAVDAVAVVDAVVPVVLVWDPEVTEDVVVEVLAGTVNTMSGMSMDLLKSCRNEMIE